MLLLRKTPGYLGVRLTLRGKEEMLKFTSLRKIDGRRFYHVLTLLLLVFFNPTNIYSQNNTANNINQVLDLIEMAKTKDSLEVYWEVLSKNLKDKILRNSFSDKKYNDLDQIELMKLSLLLNIYFEDIDVKHLSNLDFAIEKIDENLSSYYVENKIDVFHGESYEVEVERINNGIYLTKYEHLKLVYVYMKD